MIYVGPKDNTVINTQLRHQNESVMLTFTCGAASTTFEKYKITQKVELVTGRYANMVGSATAEIRLVTKNVYFPIVIADYEERVKGQTSITIPFLINSVSITKIMPFIYG